MVGEIAKKNQKEIVNVKKIEQCRLTKTSPFELRLVVYSESSETEYWDSASTRKIVQKKPTE